ncbi:DUF3099 domain-containing protein [Actinocorallia sp. A-T 12471]|uniref:DUF3099 domain-containing protein n=1 Tax=Actinocorallia sp. A-T 12471 TaxID=3089813 RepID=UPI0029CBF7EA|nr:DUF3099 domain-containing protein [Actinocorallia sp. A-T 12471]MDX6744326.1 DUF3099 domain-containing protein [Actinocorallia sp. A-T 12471]
MRLSKRRKAPVYTVTEAARPLSEDVAGRERRYLISMGIRTVCFILAVVLWRHVHWIIGALLLVGAIVLPYVSVIFANAGRTPEKAVTLEDGVSTRRMLESGDDTDSGYDEEMSP